MIWSWGCMLGQFCKLWEHPGESWKIRSDSHESMVLHRNDASVSSYISSQPYIPYILSAPKRQHLHFQKLIDLSFQIKQKMDPNKNIVAPTRCWISQQKKGGGNPTQQNHVNWDVESSAASRNSTLEEWWFAPWSLFMNQIGDGWITVLRRIFIIIINWCRILSKVG